VYEIPDAELVFTLDVCLQRIADVREQALIALFGPSTLLNSDHGGKNVTYQPNKEDMEEFGKLKTNLLADLKWLTRPAVGTDAIKSYGKECQQYAIEHPNTTGHQRTPIHDGIAKVLAEQAEASVVLSHSYALMVTIGTDLTDDAVDAERWFFQGVGLASNVLMDIMDQLAFTELSYSKTTMRPVTGLCNDHHLPFVDLFPWTAKNDGDYSAAAGFLRKYLQTTKPFVVFALADLTSSTAVGRFHHKHGLSRTGFLDHVGKLEISGYDEDPVSQADENCCIVIPSFHPGMVRHYAGDELEALLRVLSKTAAIAWLTMSRVLQASQIPGLTKSDICNNVVEEVRALTSEATDFGRTFNSVKAKFLSLRREKRQARVSRAKAARVDDDDFMDDEDETSESSAPSGPFGITPGHARRQQQYDTENFLRVNYSGLTATLSTAAVRWQQAAEELSLLINCDIARGDGWSDQRAAQIDRLIKLSLAPFKSIPAEHLRKQLKKTAKGDLFYFDVKHKPHIYLEDLSNIISLFLDESIDPDKQDWKPMTQAVEVAHQELLGFIGGQIFRDPNRPIEEAFNSIPRVMQNFLEQKNQGLAYTMRRIQQKSSATPDFFEQNGQEVKIRARRYKLYHDQLQLKWKDDDGEYDLNNFDVPHGCLPMVDGEIRTLHMLVEGIDIRDPGGRSLGTNQTRNITLPLTNLVATLEGNPLKDGFLKLWERFTQVNWQDVLWAVGDTGASNADSIEVIPASFFNGSRATTLDSVGRRDVGKKNMAKKLPFQPGDAAWLIDRFLKTKFPNGGTLYLYPAGDPVTTELFADKGLPSMFVDLLS
jgi:hypothetical protein